MGFQTEILLRPHQRGFHLITRDIESALSQMISANRGTDTPVNGVLHLFIKHTSASLTINENADPSVRRDFESHFNRLVPEDPSLFEHTLEGSDDMTSHLKSSILGHSLTIPVTNGRLNLGTWQGIYLCEHRNGGGSRRLVVTLTH